MTSNHRSRYTDERGIALILTLLLTAAISLVAASLVTIGMSETTSSQNYRMMSQARYGAESGLQAGVDYLTNTYTRPGTSGSDLLTSYTLTASPVTYNGNPVVLSSVTGASNYPDSAKIADFVAATHGTLTAGTATVGYDVTATLTSMRTYGSYGGGTSVVQSWTITGTGAVQGAGANTATVQVTSVLEQEVTLATSYGAFAVAASCGALHFRQNSETYSYDSTSYTLSSGQPAPSGTGGGDVGTNGNLQADNNVTINGSLSSPRTGVGTCVAGNPDAATLSNHATVTGGIIHLGQSKTFDTPVVPGNPPANVTTTISTSTTCATLGLIAPQCTGSANSLTLTPGSAGITFGNLILSNNVHINLSGPGNINMNTLVVNNNGVLNVTTPAGSTLTLNVAGNPIPPSTTAPATPIDIQNNTTFTNSSWDPSRVQFVYPGTGTVNINNNGVFCGTLFAPNASMTLANNGAFYGAAIGKTVEIANNGDLYFDRHLSTMYGSASNFMMSAFNWKKY